MPTVKNVGEPCAGEPHARIEVAAGGNRAGRRCRTAVGASRRPYISIGTRRLEYVACTSNPNTAWMTQQARNLLMELDDRQQRPLFLIHDRDKKFSRAFDGIFQSEGITIIRTPIQAPNANAYAERWVGSVRRDCLDRLLIFSRRQLERVLQVYVRHYNQHRPHRALELRPPNADVRAAPPRPAMLGALQVQRRGRRLWGIRPGELVPAGPDARETPPDGGAQFGPTRPRLARAPS